MKNKRFSSLCLTQHEVENLYFFSFVRDPVERFYSSVKQSMVMNKKSNITCPEIWEYLEILQNRTCGLDHHLETQSFSLSTPILTQLGGKYQVPLDFIGKLENFEEDFIQLLENVEVKNNATIPSLTKEKMLQSVKKRKNRGGAKKEMVDRCRTEEMDAMVRRVYAQDIECFQY